MVVHPVVHPIGIVWKSAGRSRTEASSGALLSAFHGSASARHIGVTRPFQLL